MKCQADAEGADLQLSLPVRGAWVEITGERSPKPLQPSLPVRGAWVEMSLIPATELECYVAPRAGSVG